MKQLNITDGVCPHCEGEGRALSQSKTRKAMKRLREGSGITQTEVARKLGVHKSFIHRLESGEVNWTRARVHQYLAAVGN